ncbi:roadblock/LC7 domain-containing protein [Kitasatospora sp. NPDC085464]|uniref:roadblock/LC7 domain-containing protein n=1 Tax=Kitasatospora sp. NPDC085464 TaxID=3364063 RepID=UPI0037C8F64F
MSLFSQSGPRALAPQQLADLVTGIPGATTALQVSPDGLVLAHWPERPADVIDGLAAAVTGLVSCARGCAPGLAPTAPPALDHNVSVYKDGSLLLLMVAGDSSLLALAGTGEAPLGVMEEKLGHLADSMTPVSAGAA